ncbi:MAG: response regulator transcription factor [Rubrivivax sp.]|nr:response regulator transcription factor [Rubrivivax sp.]
MTAAAAPPGTPPPLLALVADDEEAPREQLIAALRSAWPALRIEAAVNGVDAWDRYLELEPDLCLLDIRMPGLSGIEVAKRIAGRTPVVFVSAFGDHALAAFDAGAVDYVLKPVETPRLAQALDRLRQRLSQPAPAGAAASHTAPVEPGAAPDAPMQALLERLAAEMRRPAPLTVLQAAVGREVRLIQLDEVIYFESDARYTRVVTAAGDALIRTPLKELLAQLDERAFWQVHRSVIVNHRHIASAVRVDEGHMHLTLRGRNEKLPVSRHFQPLFKGQ